MTRILHTESSKGWGGQEMRILREAMGLRARGHEIFFAVNRGGKLIAKAREAGFSVYEVDFSKPKALKTLFHLVAILRKHAIEIVNTHSSLDAWLGGIAARCAGKKILRTRHLSTPIRQGLNSRLLYKTLADFVVTTSSSILSTIQSQANIDASRLLCVPTGIDPSAVQVASAEVAAFRESLGVGPKDLLVGTACFVRSWKGVVDLLKAAQLLKAERHIKWVIVGGGHVDDYRSLIPEMGLEGIVTFTGHLDSPYAAIQAMDLFLLLSTAHEGISQASLQAAFLKRPLVTTNVGGLPEVCVHGETGLVVPPFSPEKVAEAVLALAGDPARREQMGARAKERVEEKFTLAHTLEAMERVYGQMLLFK